MSEIMHPSGFIPGDIIHKFGDNTLYEFVEYDAIMNSVLVRLDKGGTLDWEDGEQHESSPTAWVLENRPKYRPREGHYVRLPHWDSGACLEVVWTGKTLFVAETMDGHERECTYIDPWERYFVPVEIKPSFIAIFAGDLNFNSINGPKTREFIDYAEARRWNPDLIIEVKSDGTTDVRYHRQA